LLPDRRICDFLQRSSVNFLQKTIETSLCPEITYGERQASEGSFYKLPLLQSVMVGLGLALALSGEGLGLVPCGPVKSMTN